MAPSLRATPGDRPPGRVPVEEGVLPLLTAVSTGLLLAHTWAGNAEQVPDAGLLEPAMQEVTDLHLSASMISAVVTTAVA